MILNFQNVEQFVFYDKNLQKRLPEFKHLFDTWALAKQATALRALGLRATADFLKQIEQRHLVILEEYFGTEVVINGIDYSIVKDNSFSLDEAENKLNAGRWFGNFFVSRDKEHINIDFWR
jgi:hypothetical protein